jgi:molybdate transport system regulatory protein
MHKHAMSLPCLFLRIHLTIDARIGPGKIELLEAIAACGSISAAGRAMDMSYKRAWDLVDELNHICGCKAVAQRVGGKNGGGTVLTARLWLRAIGGLSVLRHLPSSMISLSCNPKSGL